MTAAGWRPFKRTTIEFEDPCALMLTSMIFQLTQRRMLPQRLQAVYGTLPLIRARRAFWEWWLLEAVPTAWEVVPSHL